ncbi:MAG: hypothetical protein E7394_09005 [Ruminococcaceae bacterium]|nr:hypothetical protein [Oscillospiraceae bacterium]
MATLYDKNKLLNDNKDMYISEYDKGLGYEALSGIIQSKKDYIHAEKNNDTDGMKKANARANNIRAAYGGYTGGEYGNEYNPIIKSYETRSSTGYKSSYNEKKKKALDSVTGYKEFSYNPETDPVFEAYRKLYTRLGNDAYERALAQNSLRTGGVINTSASSAAMQALNRYNSMLTDKIPELYDAAYKRYSDGYDRLYKNLEILSKLEDTEYSRYRDDMKDFESDRDYYYTKHRDSIEDAMDIYRFDTNTTYKIDESDYKRTRDAVEDIQWQTEMENKDAKWRAELDNDIKRWQSEMESDNKNTHLAELTRLIQALYGKETHNNDASAFIELWKNIYLN